MNRTQHPTHQDKDYREHWAEFIRTGSIQAYLAYKERKGPNLPK